MEKYENFRENGWKLAWKDHPFFEGDSPVAKVHSRFLKRTRLDDNGGSPVPKAIEFIHKVSASWLKLRLDHVIRYTRSWNEYNIYQMSALQMYLNEIEQGGYSSGILSNQEMALLSPKK